MGRVTAGRAVEGDLPLNRQEAGEIATTASAAAQREARKRDDSTESRLDFVLAALSRHAGCPCRFVRPQGHPAPRRRGSELDQVAPIPVFPVSMDHHEQQHSQIRGRATVRRFGRGGSGAWAGCCSAALHQRRVRRDDPLPAAGGKGINRASCAARWARAPLPGAAYSAPRSARAEASISTGGSTTSSTRVIPPEELASIMSV